MAKRYRRAARTRRELADEAVRTELAGNLKTAYEAGASIRALASAHDLTYGMARTLLVESGAVLRGRGGPNHRTHHLPEECAP